MTLKDIFTEPPREYAFFRAGGSALGAALRATESQEHVKDVIGAAMAWSGADGVSYDEKAQRLKFIYRETTAPREGWEMVESGDNAGLNNNRGFYPPEGHPDRRHAAEVAAILRDLRRQTRLEEQFGVAVHAREFPAYTYPEQDFAVSRFDPVPVNGVHPALLGGKRAQQRPVPQVSDDPMLYRFVGDECYIRVPCDDRGRPVFTPPDSTEVTLSQMIIQMNARDSHIRRTGPFIA